MKDINKKQTNVDKSQISLKKEKNILLLVLKRHKISLLLILLLALFSGTLCWFIFNTKVDLGVQAHVKAWYFDFDYDDNSIEFDISDLYPGMEMQNNTVNIVNKGEIDGIITIDVESIILFGEEQIEGENFLVEREGDILKITGYPFDATIVLGKNTLTAGIEDSTTVDFKLVWDYENNDDGCIIYEKDTSYNKCDLEDTKFGERSYEFSSNKDNADLSSLVIKLKVNIVQSEA